MKKCFVVVALAILLTSICPQAWAYWDGEDPAPDSFNEKIDITLGEPFTVSLSEGVVARAYQFTPATSGDYIIESNVDDYNEPTVYLFDADYNLLDSDYRSGLGRNFRLIKYLEAGENYYYYFTSWAYQTSFSVTLSKLTADDDGFYFSYNTDRKVAFLVKYLGDDTSVTVPEYVTGPNDVQYKVAYIRNRAFSGSNVVNLTIPNTILAIHETAFDDCDDLADVTMNGFNDTYTTVDGVLFSYGDLRFYPPARTATVYNVPDTGVGYMDIYPNAFRNAKNLVTVNIHKDIDEMWDNPFPGCSNLTHINVAPGNSRYKSVDGIVFGKRYGGLAIYPSGRTDETYSVPESVTSIDSYAFRGNKHLTHVDIPESVTYIGRSAFEDCANLQNVEIPKGVDRIREKTFAGCSSLTSVTLNEGLLDIDGQAFKKCSSLSSLMIPASVNYIEDNFGSFAKEFELMVYRDSYAHTWALEKGYKVGVNLFVLEDTQGVTGDGIEYSIVNNLAYITGYSGDGGEIVIPASVEHNGETYAVAAIRSNAFKDETSITKVIISQGIIRIGQGVFDGCTGMESITIPRSVISIAWLGSFADDFVLTVYEDSYAHQWARWETDYKLNVLSKEGDQGGFIFKLNDDAKTAIVASYNGELKEVEIPGTFTDSDETVYNVVDIADGAFKNSGITRLTLPVGIVHVDRRSLAGCDKLTWVEIPDGNSTYTSKEGVLLAYGGIMYYPPARAGEDYVIPKTDLADMEILNGAFIGSKYLKSITIHDEIINIGDNAFSHCPALEAINVNENNAAYESADGVLFTKNRNTLLSYPQGKLGTSYAIPDGVKRIPYHAFNDCSNLQELTIPKSVTYINWGGIYSTKKDFKLIVDYGSYAQNWAERQGYSVVNGTLEVITPTISDNYGFEYYIGRGGNTAVIISYTGDNTRVTIPEKVMDNGIEYNVVDIEKGAFRNSGVTRLTLPSGIKHVNRASLAGCPTLASVSILPGHDTYTSLDGVLLAYGNIMFYPPARPGTNYVIPSTLPGMEILQNAFKDAKYLETVTINEDIVDIGWDAFANCDKLTAIYVDSGNSYYRSDDGVLIRNNNDSLITYPQAKRGESYTVPADLYNITGSAFNGNGYIQDVIIPEGIEYIWPMAFNNCSSLTSIKMPRSVRSIGWFDKNTFAESFMLTVYENSIAHKWAIDNGYIEGTDLVVIGVEEGTTEDGFKYHGTEGEATIIGYTGNKSDVVIPEEITGEDGEYAVVAIADEAFIRVDSFTNVTIPGCVKSIGNRSFEYCSNLRSVTIENGVAKIGNHAFSDCNNLQYMTIPGSVKSIGEYAFGWCNNLRSVTILDGVESIRNNAFVYCYNLEGVTILDIDTSIGDNAFSNHKNLVIYGYDKSTAQHWADENGVTFVSLDDVENDGFVYDFDDTDNTARIISYIGTGTTVEVPAQVTREGTPYTVKSIANGAFSDTGITGITINADLDNLSADTFSGAKELSSVMIGISENEYWTEDGVVYHQDTLLFYPPAKTEPNFALPASAQRIQWRAFDGVRYLQSVHIHVNVYNISNEAFIDCPALQSITVQSGNGSYESDGGVLFDRINGLLMRYPQAKEGIDYTIPNSVCGIGDYAFYKADKLSEITLTGRISSIGYNSFGSLSGVVFKAPLNSYAYLCLKNYKGIDVEATSPGGVTGTLEAGQSFTAPTEWNSVLEFVCDTSGSYIVACQSDYYPRLDIFDDKYRYIASQHSNSDGYSLVFDADKGVTYYIITSFNKSYFNPYVDYTVTLEATSKSDVFYYSLDGNSVRIDKYIGNEPNVIIPSVLTVAGIEYPVKAIGPSAFEHNSGIISVVMPDGITHIGANAFSNCPNLDIDQLPASLTVIGGHAFASTGITDLTIPANVADIGVGAFANCNSLTDVTVLQGVKSISASMFEYCSQLKTVSIPDGAVSIGYGAFRSCVELTSVTIPDSVESIEGEAFAYCSSLTSVTIPEGIAIINYGTFYNCLLLDNVSIPEGVESIGVYAFGNCSSLQNVTIPASVTLIDYNAFYGCSGLSSVTIPASVTFIGNGAFIDCGEGFVIYGYTGSEAQAYANRDDISFTPLPDSPGDVVLDGVFDAKDVQAVLDHISNLYPITDSDMLARADVYQDESSPGVNNRDAVKIYQMAAGN